MPCDLFQKKPHYHWSFVSPVRGRHFRVRRRLCCPQTESPLRGERVPQGSALPDEQSGSCPITGQEKRIIVQKFAHFQQFSRPGAKGSLGVKLHVCCASGRTSLNIGLRVFPHEPGLKPVCGHRRLILLGRAGAPHDSPTTRPHRKGCNSGTAFVQGLQRLQSGHSGKAHWRPTRLDIGLRSARARGTLTSGGQG